MRRLADQSGVTIAEMMFYGAIVAMVGLVLSRFLQQPAQLAKAVTRAQQQVIVDRVTSLAMDDIRCAYSDTVQWNALDPSSASYDAGVNSGFIPWFQIHMAPGSATNFAYVCYSFEASDNTVVRRYTHNTPSNLTRCVSGDPATEVTETKIAEQIQAPTASNPLFVRDPAAQNTIILNFQFVTPAGAGPGYKPLSIVRRAHIRS